MIILAMDTSGPAAGVAVMRDGRVAYEAMAVNKLTHSASLMPMLDEALGHADIQKRDVDLLAVTAGPGSYTGVRIGVAAAKGLSLALNCPVVPVDALAALAMSCGLYAGITAAIQDARGGRVYAAAFRAGELPERLTQDEALPLRDFLASLAALSDCPVFVGDGVSAYQDIICAAMPGAVLASEPSRMLRPANVALFAHIHPELAVPGEVLQPIYLAAPQAERTRLQKESLT